MPGVVKYPVEPGPKPPCIPQGMLVHETDLIFFILFLAKKKTTTVRCSQTKVVQEGEKNIWKQAGPGADMATELPLKTADISKV